MNGSWSFFGEEAHVVTILEGIKEAVSPATKVTYAQGCHLYQDTKELFSQAVNAAKQAEVVVMVLGESAVMNGEAGSRADIRLPGVQEDLLAEIAKIGKKVVLVSLSGRPLELSLPNRLVPSILHTWTLGSEAGRAVADVLFGDYNPSGKLPMTFPRHVGQVPIYYAQKNTGRPYTGDYSEPKSERVYRGRYWDVPNDPLFPFGFGLSYTTFTYGKPTLSASSLSPGGKITLTVSITNTGERAGEEVVQLYIRDLVGSVTRPIKELKGFKKLSIEAGKSVEVSFDITEADLAFHKADMTFGSEPGKFKIFVGADSENVQELDFELLD